MAHYEHLPIYRTALQLAIHLEKTVQKFSRYNKYTLGSEMRGKAHDIVARIITVNTCNEDRIRALEELRDSIARLTVYVRISNELKAFHSFGAFSTSTEALISLGRQIPWDESHVYNQIATTWRFMFFCFRRIATK